MLQKDYFRRTIYVLKGLFPNYFHRGLLVLFYSISIRETSNSISIREISNETSNGIIIKEITRDYFLYYYFYTDPLI